MMLQIIVIGASMKLVNRPDQIVLTAAADRMLDGAGGIIDYFPALANHSSAKIDILPIQKKSLIKSSDFFQGFPSYHHAGAGNPINFHGVSAVAGIGQYIRTDNTVFRKQLRQ